MTEEEEFIAELERKGVDQVRAEWAAGEYPPSIGFRGPLVRKWLQLKEGEESRESRASNLEQIRIARSAKNAAWTAAIAAIVAAIIAAASAVIASLAIR